MQNELHVGVVVYYPKLFGASVDDLQAFLGWCATLQREARPRFIEGHHRILSVAAKERRLEDVAPDVLAEEVRAGTIDKVQLFQNRRKDRGREYGAWAEIGFRSEALSIHGADHPYSLRFATPASAIAAPEDVAAIVTEMMERVGSPYAVVYVSDRLGDVSQELALMPTVMMGQDHQLNDPRTVPGHVQRLQMHRGVLGTKARGAYWGNFLGTALVEQLGGVERVLREAPTVRTRLVGSVVYLQATDEYASRADPNCAAALDKLESFLQPVLPW